MPYTRAMPLSSTCKFVAVIVVNITLLDNARTLRKSALSADMERSTRVRGAHIVLRVIQRMDIFTRNALPLQRATVHAHPVHSKPARRLFAHTGYHSGVPAMRWRAHAHATCHAMTATLLS